VVGASIGVVLLSIVEADASTLGANARVVVGRGTEIASAARGKTTSAVWRMRSSWSRGTVGSVRGRIEALLRDRRLQAAGDSVLAFVLAATSVGTILAGDHTSWGHPELLAVPLALASSVPVAWRARRPLLAAAVVLVANGACSYVAAPHQAAFQPFVALTLVAYSVGSRFEGGRWIPALLAVAAMPLFVVAVAHGQSAGNAIPNYVWLIAA
jgi:hypothetical protein